MPAPKKRSFSKIKLLIVAVWLGVFGYWVKTTINLPPPLALDAGLLPSSEDYLSVYFNNEKIGWHMYALTKLEEGYISEQRSFLKLNLAGEPEEVRTILTVRLGLDFTLEQFTYIVTTGPIRFVAKGQVEGQKITVSSQSGPGPQETATVNFSGKLIMPSALPAQIARQGLKEGARYTFPVFNPLTMKVEPVTTKVVEVARKKVPELPDPVRAYKLQLYYQGLEVNSWVDSDGRVIEEDSQMGLKIVRTTFEEATSGLPDSGALSDIVQATSVFVDLADSLSPEKKEALEDYPRDLSYLQVGFEGLDLSGFHLAGGVQDLRQDRLIIAVPAWDEIKNLPNLSAQRADLAPFLSSEHLIQVEDPAIVELAAELKQKSSQPAGQALAVMDWTRDNLEKRPTMSIPSASQVMAMRYGDCNEHTVLATALLRALKIPARPVAGLLYDRGSFFYHAWVEIYLGDSWIPADPLLGSLPADATHIRLVIGNLEEQARLAGLMGRLRVKIYDLRD